MKQFEFDGAPFTPFKTFYDMDNRKNYISLGGAEKIEINGVEVEGGDNEIIVTIRLPKKSLMMMFNSLKSCIT